MDPAQPGSATLDSTRGARVEAILSQITQLPTLPAVAVRVLQATSSERTSARDVVRLVEADAALTAKILRLLRSADLGLNERVMSVERAVVLLGFETVRNAVLSIQVYETFAAAEPGAGSALIRAEFWKHSLATACAAEMAAKALGTPDVRPDEAFVCGLLHDIGKIALDACLPKSYGRVVKRCELEHACICDVERDMLGLDHAVAGKRLLSHWRLPQAVVDCAWLHHQSVLPDSVRSGRLVAVVHLADNLVRRQRIGFSGYHHVEPVEELAAGLGLSQSVVQSIARSLPERLERLGDMFGLADLSSQSVYTQALADANTELGCLNAKLADTNRRLELRCQCFDTQRRFVHALGEKNGVGPVCEAVAEATGRMFGSQPAVAHAGISSDQMITVGVWSGTDDKRSHLVVNLGSLPVEFRGAPLGRSGRVAAIAEASAVDRALWERVSVGEAASQLWALPIVHAGETVGGVVFAATADVVASFTSLADECEAISSFFGLAISSATARTDAETLSEDLLEMNRRLKTAQSELLRTRSLSMIAEMAAGAAHELNNPLAVIAGRAQLLWRDVKDESTAHALEIIREQTSRASNMVTELLQFAKPSPPRPLLLRLSDVFESLWQHWNEASSLADDQPVFELADARVSVYADADQLTEILSALISNAIEAAKSENAQALINSPSSASDETVRIRVEDNGVGMTPEVLSKAFDPFFSSRPAGRGRGLGLSRAQRLIEINGGRLWLESTQDAGTTAFIELPARPPEGDETSPHQQPTAQ